MSTTQHFEVCITIKNICADGLRIETDPSEMRLELEATSLELRAISGDPTWRSWGRGVARG